MKEEIGNLYEEQFRVIIVKKILKKYQKIEMENIQETLPHLTRS